MLSELEIIFENISPLSEPDINCPNLEKDGIDIWFNKLRFTDQVESLNIILAFIEKSNQYKVDVTQRIYLLEKIHTPVLSFIGSIKPKFLNTKLPLDKISNEQVDLCIKVYEHLTLSYSIVLLEQLANKNKSWSFLRSLDSKIALTMQRLIRYLSQIVLTEFEVYRQSDKKIWMRLYTLFSFSEKKGFSSIAIKDPILEENTSIKVTFLQILLLALSDPYHFNQQQIYYIYKHLANWAKFVDIVANKSIKQDMYTAINLTDEYMPTFFPRGQKPNHKQSLYIDTHKLSFDVLRDDNDSNYGFLSPQIKKCLLAKLQSSWQVYADRSFDRNDYYSELKVVIGIHRVHFVLNNYQHPSWVKNAEYTSKTSLVDSSDYSHLMDDLPFQNNKPNEVDYEQMLDSVTYESKPEVDVNVDHVVEAFLTENESLNGLSLIWNKEYSINIKIGEVIALSNDTSEKPTNWFIGAIRRIQHLKNEPLRVGVQMLCPTGAKAIEINKKNEFKAYSALYLSEFNVSNQTIKLNEPASVLVDALTFKQGMDVKITAKQEEKYSSMDAELFEDIETTPYYMRFKYRKK